MDDPDKPILEAPSAEQLRNNTASNHSSAMYRSVVLAKRPKNTIVPGETFTIKTKTVPTKADLKNGEVIFETLYLSLDPAMRGWLNGKQSHLAEDKPDESRRLLTRASCLSY
jgi:NADPH-dependent curcumin reductase CurA